MFGKAIRSFVTVFHQNDRPINSDLSDIINLFTEKTSFSNILCRIISKCNVKNSS